MGRDEWPQRVIEFGDFHAAEQIVAQHLMPVLERAEHDLGLRQWSFLRKFPTWRLRFQLPSAGAVAVLDDALEAITAAGVLMAWRPGIYEPETSAFGGEAGMDVAHTLFHQDSRHILTHPRRIHGIGRRELALILISTAMRAAGLDWFEQGDVWAKVAAQRPRPAPAPREARAAVHRLMTADVSSTSPLVSSGPLAPLTDWASIFERSGQQLADLNRSGHLERGLRSVLAHHVIFHWNRLGLSLEDQSTLSTLAKETVMGTSDNTVSNTNHAPGAATVSEVHTDAIEAAPDAILRNRLVDQLTADGAVRTTRIGHAMRTVPRHLFVPHAPLEQAYSNRPVNTKLDNTGAPISCASQPDIVARMLEQLDVQPGQRVLELGAGTGFNAGLLRQLVGDDGYVTTVDVDEDIVDGARAGLAAAGAGNVTVILGDGAVGYTPFAPYDRIVATVGVHGMPKAWLDQLAPGGRLLTPVRLRGSVSRSIAFEQHDGRWLSVGSEMNTFMPLRRGIADDPRGFVPVAKAGAVTLVTNGDQDVDAEALTHVLHQPGTEIWTGVLFRGPESAEWLELWLTCTLPNGISRMAATQQAIETRLLSAPYPSSSTTFDKGALAYLTRRKSTQTAPDGATLYEFGVIGHGPGSTELAERVTTAAQEWDRTHREHDVTFEILPPTTTPPEARPDRFTLETSLNGYILEWQ